MSQLWMLSLNSKNVDRITQHCIQNGPECMSLKTTMSKLLLLLLFCVGVNAYGVSNGWEELEVVIVDEEDSSVWLVGVNRLGERVDFIASSEKRRCFYQFIQCGLTSVDDVDIEERFKECKKRAVP
jgi:hypothetical protein